jgi:hypothetical protein
VAEAGDAVAGGELRGGLREGEVLFVGELLNSAGEAVCGDGAGVDGVDADAVGDAAVGEGLGEEHEGGVDGAAEGELGARGAATDAGDVDDGAAGLDEVGPGGAAESGGAVEFQFEAVVPVLIGEGEEVAAPGSAGVVDDEVDAAEGGEGGFDEARGAAGAARSAGKARARAPVDLISVTSSSRAGAVRAARATLHAFATKGLRDSAAEASAGAGDKGYFVAEVEVQISLRTWVRGRTFVFLLLH